jgi:hypothetical protein
VAPQWVPNATLEEVVARVTAPLLAVYAAYEQDMLTWLGRQLAAAETPEDARSFEQQMLNVSDEALRARQVVRQLEDVATDAALDMVETASEFGMATALSQLEARGLTPRDYPTVSPAVYSVIGDLGNALDEAHRRILRVPDDMYREINAIGSAQGILHGQPLKSRHYRIWSEFVNNGIRGFTDVAGRNWNMVSYVEMASRTTVARAYRAQQVHTLLENDLNLVAVSTAGDACQDCASWSGKVLSVDGSPAGQYLQWSPLTGQDTTVTVHATLEDASASGHLFGPNCQCATIPYLPGDTPPRSIEYDKDEHQARESQRYHEREIRRLKREKLVDPELSSDYEMRIRGHQARIRELVEDYGLNRKREREQINHGYRRRN